MPRPCSICTHPQRDDIDTDIVRGQPFRRIATQRGVTEQSVRRHGAAHLPKSLARAHAAQAITQADDLLDEVRELHSRVRGILEKAEKSGDLRAATGAIREARSMIELLAKLTGELDDKPEVNVVLSPQWLTIRGAILEALEPFPEARVAVGARLLTVAGAS
jgi:hypothetical protein